MNLLIETKEPYEEDDCQQIRIANILFRLVGFTPRCNATMSNYSTNQRNFDNEPNSTLFEYRRMTTGVMFGTFNQPEFLASNEEVKGLLGTDYPEIKDRSLSGESGVIKKDDIVYIRVKEKTVVFKKKDE